MATTNPLTAAFKADILSRIPGRGWTDGWLAEIARRTDIPDRIDGLYDPQCAGNFIRIQKSGLVTFYWNVRERLADGTVAPRNVRVGPHSPRREPGKVTLDQAREWVERLREAHRENRLPDVERELVALLASGPDRRRAPEPAPAPTSEKVSEAYALWFRHLSNKIEEATQDNIRSLFGGHVLPVIGDLALDEVKREHGIEIIRRLTESDKPRRATACKALDKAQQFLRWCERNGKLADRRSPFDGLRAEDWGGEVGERGRALTHEEIPVFWYGLDGCAMSDAARAVLRFLLLIPDRRGELHKALWGHFEPDAQGGALWVVPPQNRKLPKRERPKTEPLRVYLPPLAWEQVQIMRQSAPGDLACGVPYSETDRLMLVALAGYTKKVRGKTYSRQPTLVLPGDPLRSDGKARPTPHSLRHTFATRATDPEVGVDPFIAQRCLAHKVGGVDGVYDKSFYFEQRKEAVTKWCAHVAKLLREARPEPLREPLRVAV